MSGCKRTLPFAVVLAGSLAAVLSFLLILGPGCSTPTPEDDRTPAVSRTEPAEPAPSPDTVTTAPVDSGEVDSLSVLSPSQAQKRELVELSEEHRKTDFGAVVTAEPGVVANQSVTATFDTDGDGRASSWGDYQYGLAEPGGMGGMGGMGMGGYGGGRIAPPPFTGRPSISSESQLSLKTEDYQRSAETELLYRRLDKKQDAYWYSTHPAKTVEESLLAGTQRSPRQAPAFPADLAYVMADEIWVICRPPAPPSPPPDDGPGSGCLMAKLPDQDKQVALPLRHTDVQARITGYIASVDVTQNFHNPYDAKIEAVYVFPLPQNAAVNDFVMTIGDRTIRGIIRERQEAEQIYAAARREGHVASLLTQERPNIFTQKVANIEPKKQIDVRIHYFNTLAYVDGWYEFVFPLVVGPRFNPPGFTEGVGAVGRGKTGISGQDTEVQYLKPHERSGADVALTVELDAGVSIEQIKSTNHVITQEQPRPEQAVVKLSPLDTVPNKDFVLRYKVAGRRLKSALVTHRDERGGFFTLMLYPPEQTRHVRRAPLEMVFVLDCSGSMNGKPIEKAKDAVKRALRCLQEGDTFQVIRFSNNASTFGPAPIAATRDNVQKAIEYVENLRGSGGTMMIEGIKTALDFAHDPERFRFVCFLTDGYIGNEAQILAAVHERLGASRIFSFGVGTSVNRFLIDRLAKIGRGAVAYISLDDDATDAVDSFYERIQYPALTDIEIDFGGMQVAEVYPRRIPDLFVGRPVIVTGRFQGDGNATVKVKGKLAGKDYRQEFSLNLAEPAAAGHEALAFVWARKKIEQLSLIESADAAAAAQAGVDLPAQIKDLALEYSLMSRYTAFVAVDSSRRTEGDHGVIVPVAVPVPDGVRYETTVQE